jgi:hypothetical protein
LGCRGDGFVDGNLPCLLQGVLDSAGEDDLPIGPRPSLGHGVRDNDDRHTYGMAAAPAVGDLADGISADAASAVWYADVPNKRCVRVQEGGQVQETVEIDRGRFACALGGRDRDALFIVATEWNGPGGMFQGAPTGQVLTTSAPAPGAGWP